MNEPQILSNNLIFYNYTDGCALLRLYENGCVVGCHFVTNCQLWSDSDMSVGNFLIGGANGASDSFKMDQGTSVFDMWVKDSSITCPRNIFRAYNNGSCIVIGQGCSANNNAVIPVFFPHAVSVARGMCADSAGGLAIGENYADEGGWHTQLNMKGCAYTIARWKHACGTASASNVHCGHIFVHCDNPFTIASCGNMRICTGSATGYVCIRGETCVERWIRQDAQKGLYWSNACAMHLYPPTINGSRLLLRSSNGNTGLDFSASNNNTVMGTVYANNDKKIGFLDADGNWSYTIHCDTDHRWYINNTQRMQLASNILNVETTAGLCVTEWARFCNAKGLYWQNSCSLHLRGSGANLNIYNHHDTISLQLGVCANAVIAGYVYGNCHKQIGFLDSDGSWAYMHCCDDVHQWRINNTERMVLNNNCLGVYTQYGNIVIGPQNADWAHIQTDREKFYFNKRVIVDSGIVASYFRAGIEESFPLNESSRNQNLDPFIPIDVF